MLNDKDTLLHMLKQDYFSGEIAEWVQLIRLCNELGYDYRGKSVWQLKSWLRNQ